MKVFDNLRLAAAVLLALIFSNSSHGQTATATCDGITSATENRYRIVVGGLIASSTYDISIDGTLVADDFTGDTTFTSADQLFADGTDFKDVAIDEDGDGIGVVNVTVHELLCTDADGDGDIDQNEASCDYSIAFPNIGTIVSQVAPHNTENVYLYVLTNQDGLTPNPVVTNYTGYFTRLVN